MANTFGRVFTLTTFGESHGAAIGGVIDGMPPGVPVDEAAVQAELDRRRPGQSRITTSRKEEDRVEILSGVFRSVTTGAPIGFIVRNSNAKPSDYDNMERVFRPSHADFTYHSKYGVRDHRGGGRSSARITISRCVGGAFAKMALGRMGISVRAFTSQIGHVSIDPAAWYDCEDIRAAADNPVRCPDPAAAGEMERLLWELKGRGDTTGGVVSAVIKGCPPGVGEPEFGKLHAQLGAAMLGINAVKGFEYGDGFSAAALRGSQANDIFENAGGRISTKTNHSGGIQGGISNGRDIYFRVAFKPIATLLMEQQTVDEDGRPVTLIARGRHDPCAVPRAVPIVEAMAAMVLLDNILAGRASRL